MSISITTAIMLTICGMDYKYGPDIVTNIVVTHAKMRFEELHKEMQNAPSNKVIVCCNNITSGHQIESGTGTVIMIRKFYGYRMKKREGGMFMKVSIYLPFLLKKNIGEIAFNSDSGMIGYLSSGAPSDSRAWSCYAYAKSGLIKYRNIQDRIYIAYKLKIKPRLIGKNHNLECIDEEIEYSGYYYLRDVADLDHWEGKPGKYYYEEAEPETGFRHW